MKELSTVMRSLGQNPTDAEVQDIINEVDVDGSGSMEFPEFCIMMVKKMAETDTENEVQEAYRVFDKDKDGFITRQELRMIFAALPERLMPEQIEEMLDAADDDGIEVDILDLLIIRLPLSATGSGRFEYEEFKTMLGSGNNRGKLF